MNEMNSYNIVFRHDFPRDYVILCASFFESDLTDSFAVFSLLTVADNMLKERKCEMKGTGKRILSVSLSVMMALGKRSRSSGSITGGNTGCQPAGDRGAKG